MSNYCNLHLIKTITTTGHEKYFIVAGILQNFLHKLHENIKPECTIDINKIKSPEFEACRASATSVPAAGFMQLPACRAK